VGSVVRAARAGLQAARALECVLVFAAGGFLALGAARLSGAPAGAWDVALLCGALAAASWWLEHPSAPVATARELDAALRHDGALALAFELEESRAPDGFTPMEELVRARVLARLSVRSALRAVFPPPFLPLAAPAVAGLFLLFALDRRGAPEEGDLGAMGAALERALPAGIEPEGAKRESGAAVELRREARELRALLGTHERLPPASGEKARAAFEARIRLERLDQLVARELQGAAPASELRERLDEARAWIDALRAALPEAAAASSDPDLAAGSAGTAAGNLTSPTPDGTISPPMAPAALPPNAPETTPSITLGLQAGSFWTAEYDAVVERWVELSRAARAGQAR
jgi:hypothetical protein